eukprot:snap_masked-scaffold_1-processed-gene-7.1-mRNA-1 protein AED:1.00 eAED:1.00 QI:0/0/0/0/1/1/2/0/62
MISPNSVKCHDASLLGHPVAAPKLGQKTKSIKNGSSKLNYSVEDVLENLLILRKRRTTISAF